MLTTREYAGRAMDTLRAPRPVAEGTLHVTGVPAVWPPDVVAKYVVRAAAELGCSKIAVHHPAGSVVTFDLVELVTGVVRAVGYWPRPTVKKKKPGPLQGFALAGFRGLGSGVERVRRWTTGSAAFPGLNLAPTKGD